MTYAVSGPGHGASWTPGFWRMHALGTKDILVADVVAVIEEIWRKEGEGRVALVGYSSGGGLSQLILSKGVAEGSGTRTYGSSDYRIRDCKVCKALLEGRIDPGR